jgi:proline racemase
LPSNESGEYKIETVTGLISVTAVMEKEEVVSVKLESEPCHVIQPVVPLVHSRLNTKFSLVQADQTYAVFEKGDLPLEIRVEDLTELKSWARTVFQALDSEIPVILVDDSALQEGRIKSITFREDQFIVRSPGFGPTLACYTSLLAKGALRLERGLVNESIFNSRLSAQAAEQTENGYQFAVTSRGFITGLQTFVLDPTDPLDAGFLLK